MGTHWSQDPPPRWMFPWSRAVCKRFHDDMRPSNLVVKSLTHGAWSGNMVNRKPSRGGGVFRSTSTVPIMTGTVALDGYCSTVQGLLDWFEVDLELHQAFYSEWLVYCLSTYRVDLHENVDRSILTRGFSPSARWCKYCHTKLIPMGTRWSKSDVHTKMFLISTLIEVCWRGVLAHEHVDASIVI